MPKRSKLIGIKLVVERYDAKGGATTAEISVPVDQYNSLHWSVPKDVANEPDPDGPPAAMTTLSLFYLMAYGTQMSAANQLTKTPLTKIFNNIYGRQPQFQGASWVSYGPEDIRSVWDTEQCAGFADAGEGSVKLLPCVIAKARPCYPMGIA